jgi:REP element-mobilizing transposase RayT
MRTKKSPVFHEIFLHINWHCQGDLPLIKPGIEPTLYHFLKEYCGKTEGVYFCGVGGTRDHVHVGIQIAPTVLISDFVGKIKGASSFDINQKYGGKSLKWQRGYGVVSFAKRNLDAVLKYVANQKQHHRAGTVRATLEEVGHDEEEEVGEEGAKAFKQAR